MAYASRVGVTVNGEIRVNGYNSRMPLPVRRFKAGDTIEDLCRACKGERLHTVVVADIDGAPLRVICDYCRSEHNYRGGARPDAGTGAEQHRTAPPAGSPDRRFS